LARPVRAEEIEALWARLFHRRGGSPSLEEMALQREPYPPKATNLCRQEGAVPDPERAALRVGHFPLEAGTGPEGADSAVGI
jgi:hypothetical protein